MPGMLLARLGAGARRLGAGTRRLKRRLKRWTTPPFPALDLAGPVLVFGSAPGSRLPEGFGEDWRIVTINGSHGILAGLTDRDPDVTLMMFAHALGKSPNTPGVRAQVSGRRTGTLVVCGGRTASRREEMDGLPSLEYASERAVQLSGYQRRHLIQDATGRPYEEDSTEAKASTGLLAAMLALRDGGSPVVVSGIAPGSQGHAYAQPDGRARERRHSGTDAAILSLLREKGHPLFTADPEVAEALGLPLWSGGGAYIPQRSAPS